MRSTTRARGQRLTLTGGVPLLRVVCGLGALLGHVACEDERVIADAVPAAGGSAGASVESGGAPGAAGGSGHGGAAPVTGTGGAPAMVSPPPVCTETLVTNDVSQIAATCSFQNVCDQLGCGPIDGELDQCGNERAACKSNADCRASEVCTPLAAWGVSIGCGPDCEGDPCRCAVNACAGSPWVCTRAEGLPAPCVEYPGTDAFRQIVDELASSAGLDMSSAISDPYRLCLERFQNHADELNGACVETCDIDGCPADCRAKCDADSGQFYKTLLAVILGNEAPAGRTACEETVARLP